MTDRFTARREGLRRQRWFRILLGAAAVLVIGLLVWLVWFSSVLTARTVDVSGQTTLKAQQIRAAAKVPVGRPLARVDLTAIETRVEQLPRVRSVTVSRSWPHTISIEVTERTAVVWMTVEGEVHGVDRSGVDFRTYSKPPKGLVEAKVAGYDAEVRLETIRAVAATAAFLREQRPDWYDQIRAITGSTQDSVEIDLSKGRTIVWGSAAEGERKLGVLKSLLTIKARGYDVSAPDQPTTKD